MSLLNESLLSNHILATPKKSTDVWFDKITTPINIYSGWTQTSSVGVTTYNSTTLVVKTSQSHNKQRTYIDRGSTEGQIAFTHYYADGVGYYKQSNNHSIFRVRTSYINAGTYYNEDSFDGWEIYQNTTGNFVFRERTSQSFNSLQEIVLIPCVSGVTNTFKIKWTPANVYISLNNIIYKAELNNNVAKTFNEIGYAMYDGNMTFTSITSDSFVYK